MAPAACYFWSSVISSNCNMAFDSINFQKFSICVLFSYLKIIFDVPPKSIYSLVSKPNWFCTSFWIPSFSSFAHRSNSSADFCISTIGLISGLQWSCLRISTLFFSCYYCWGKLGSTYHQYGTFLNSGCQMTFLDSGLFRASMVSNCAGMRNGSSS